MKKRMAFLCTVVMMVTALFGCAKTADTVSEDTSLSIVTTIFPAYDFARAVAGDKAEITMLIKPGAEIHTFDPSPADIIKIKDADVFIYIGGESEDWVETILESMDTEGKTIIRLMDSVTLYEEEIVEGMEHEHEEGDHAHDTQMVEVEDDHAHDTETAEAEDDHAHDTETAEAEDDHAHDMETPETEETNDHADDEVEYDEHIWTSLSNAVKMVGTIEDVLCEVDLENAQAYHENAASYQGEIKEVEEEMQEIAANAVNKLIVVADRFPFRYLTEELGLDYRAAFAGCSTEAEASAGTIAYLIDTVKENSLPYIYYADFSTQNIARAVAEETGAEMLLLHSCHNVTKDELESKATYVSLMKQNMEALRKGLIY